MYVDHHQLRHREFYMRKFEDLTKREKEILVFGEAKNIMRILEHESNMDDMRWMGMDRLAIDYDCILYMKDKDTKRYQEMVDKFVKSIIQESEYRCSGVSVPSDTTLSDD